MADHGPRPGLPGAPRPGAPAARVVLGRPPADRPGTPGVDGSLAASTGVAESVVPGSAVVAAAADSTEVRTPVGLPRSGSPAPGTVAGSDRASSADELAAWVDAELATLAGRPPAEHPEVYARLHTGLTDALAATAEQGR